MRLEEDLLLMNQDGDFRVTQEERLVYWKGVGVKKNIIPFEMPLVFGYQGNDISWFIIQLWASSSDTLKFN